MCAGLTLHPVGLNEEETKILSVAMNVLLACGCGVRFSEQMTGEAVAVIDIDSEEGRSFYEHADAALTHRSVVIAGDNASYHAAGLIRKPLRVQTLRNILSELSEQGGVQEPLQSPVPSQATPQSAVHSVEDVPNDSLFYTLVNAVANGHYLKVTGKSGQHQLLIHGPTRHLYSNMSRQEMAQAVKFEAADLDVTMLDEFSFMKLARGLMSCRIEKLLWQADAYGARGYPPVNYHKQAAFHLTDWPRFDVKHVKPEYLTLSAIMTRQTLSPDSLARMTGIGINTIFDFYHAALACGVVEQRVAQEEALTPEQAPPVRHLVGRIAKKLGLSFF